MKKPIEFIKKRIKKKALASEFYKSEMAEHKEAFLNSFKEIVILSFILQMISLSLNLSHFFIIFYSFSFSFFLWKISQKSMLSWNRLNKLHKIIEEEKYSIEHKKDQEKKELEMIYKAKGFEKDLLKEIVNVIMADENRLLQVMIEEEMGLVFRKYEHPLKVGIFAGLGVICGFIPLRLALIGKNLEFYLIGAFLIIINSFFYAKEEKKNISFAIVWDVAILAFITSFTFFLIKVLL